MRYASYSQRLSVFLSGLVLVMACLAGCGSDEADDGRPTVVATTTMIEDLARTLGGEEVNVVGLMRTIHQIQSSLRCLTGLKTLI